MIRELIERCLDEDSVKERRRQRYKKSDDWKRVGRDMETEIREETDHAIRVVTCDYVWYKNVRTGEEKRAQLDSKYDRWHFFDDRSDWDDWVRKQYNRYKADESLQDSQD